MKVAILGLTLFAAEALAFCHRIPHICDWMDPNGRNCALGRHNTCGITEPTFCSRTYGQNFFCKGGDCNGCVDGKCTDCWTRCCDS